MTAEAENNLLLSSALTVARVSSGRLPKLSYFTVLQGRKTVAAALHVSDRRLLLSAMSREAARFMGAELARRSQGDALLRAVLGPQELTGDFSSAYAKVSGLKLVPVRELLQMQVKAQQLSFKGPAAPGLWRTAREKDLPRLLDWSHRFVTEAGHDEPMEETEEAVRRYLENRQLLVWDDHRPVAMAGYGGLTENGARIHMVYTDPAARGRGYAASLVAALSRKLLSQGERKFCFLFVSSDNPTAARLYRKLGFERFGTFSEFRSELFPGSGSKPAENDPTAKGASH